MKIPDLHFKLKCTHRSVLYIFQAYKIKMYIISLRFKII